MKYISVLLLIILFSCKETKTAQDLPNIIYIMADDLGYAELGAYGQTKIETPNLDALASSGMLFTQHYTSAPVCAPARCMLLTGKHSGHAYIRGNDEWSVRGNVWDYRAMAKDSTLEGQRPLPKSTVTIGHQLQKAGYKTGIVGKWGLGAPNTHSTPLDMGFDFFYGYNCQRQAHTYYPLFLYKNRSRDHLENDTIPPGTKLAKDADPLDPSSYAAFNLKEYAPDLMYKEIGNFVDQNQASPFFLYWATPIPHVALQAPKRWVDYYQKKFGKEDPYLGKKGYFPHPSPRAAYAGMVSYLDENIGKLIVQLKELGIYDNTLIVFTSDNGPSFAGGADSPWFDSANPFKSEKGYGKGFVHEGGIRVPMIASWPGHISPGSKTDHISVHYDVFSTLSDIVNQEVVNSDGISFLPTLRNKGTQSNHEFLFWEFPEYGGQVAIRMGKWKVIRKNLKNKEKPTLELYNLEQDIQEQNNLAEEHPDIIARAAEIFKTEHTSPAIERFRIPLIDEGNLLSSEE